MRKYLKEGKYSYDQNEKLGNGSFGKVFKAYNHQQQKWIALKQIQLKKLEEQGDDFKEIVLSEITVMKKFTKNMIKQPCQYLVRQQDCFRTELYIYIAMEICSGGTLQDQMKNKKYSEQECQYVIYCIAKGLEYMSRMGIVHRDLKPQNIFITRDPESGLKLYKIGDFGFATHKKNLDLAMGTLLYMAPEMFLKGEYTNKVDIWSFGIICYQIFFRIHYFIGKDRWAIKKSILEKQFFLNDFQKKSISSAYQNLLFLCLVKQPEFRLAPQNLFKQPFLANFVPFKPENPVQAEKMNTFDKIDVLIKECQRLREMAEQFFNFSLQTLRITQFIQIYLLKDAYAMMNRIAYTMIHKQDYIGMDAEEFNEILKPQNSQKYESMSKKAQNQCLFISGLFNEKYRQFQQRYIKKFKKQDCDLISKVINQQPYEYTNQKVMERQLQKWVRTLKKYPQWIQLQQNCEKVYKIKSGS